MASETGSPSAGADRAEGLVSGTGSGVSDAGPGELALTMIRGRRKASAVIRTENMIRRFTMHLHTA